MPMERTSIGICRPGRSSIGEVSESHKDLSICNIDRIGVGYHQIFVFHLASTHACRHCHKSAAVRQILEVARALSGGKRDY